MGGRHPASIAGGVSGVGGGRGGVPARGGWGVWRGHIILKRENARPMTPSVELQFDGYLIKVSRCHCSSLQHGLTKVYRSPGLEVELELGLAGEVASRLGPHL